jgi:hypothetical protein
MRSKLSVDNPAVAAEWDYEKNAGLCPDDFTGGSEKKVWWRCSECDHRWEAKIYSRTEGRGCPVCGRNRVKPGVNDLATLSPALAAEWDYEENAPLLPTGVTGGASRKVWWMCKFGHSWENTVNHRFNDGQNCPYCNNSKVLAGFNDLATTHPRVAAEWHAERNGERRPKHFTAGADAKVWWRCRNCGYEWESFIYSRTNGKTGTNCPCCARNILVCGVNDLKTVNPAVAAEWDDDKNGDLRPDGIAANNNGKMWWRCEKGHSWAAVVYSRNRGNGCPYCGSRTVLPGFNDFATLRPDIAGQWDYEKNRSLTPQCVSEFSSRKVWWKCSKGHRWKTAVANRSAGSGCPYCANRIAEAGVTDLRTLRPDIADQWDPEKNGTLTPERVTPGSSRNVWWTCGRGHSFEAPVVGRVHGRGCPYCDGKRPIVGETDFASVHPELLDEWDRKRNGNKKPEHFTYGSKKKVWWKCAEGHCWKAAIGSRHSGRNCPVCGKLKDKHVITVGVNDLATVYPSIADEWDYGHNDGLTPQQVLPGSNKKVWWICRRGHRWKTSVLARTTGTRCPKCNRKTSMRTKFIT